MNNSIETLFYGTQDLNKRSTSGRRTQNYRRSYALFTTRPTCLQYLVTQLVCYSCPKMNEIVEEVRFLQLFELIH